MWARLKDERFAIADAVNLAALLAAMGAYAYLNVFDFGLRSTPPLPETLAFHLTHGLFLWSVVIAVCRMPPWPQPLVAPLYAWLFALFFTYLYADLQTLYFFRIHLNAYFIRLLFEPGILIDLAISGMRLMLIAGGTACLLVLQALLLAANRYGTVRRAARTIAASGWLVVASIPVSSASWLTWSYQSHVHLLEASYNTGMLPVFPPRYADLGLSDIWQALDIPRRHIAADLQTLRVRYQDAIETRAHRAFRDQFTLPENVTSTHDWNIVYIVAESWRWDTFTPEVMPNLTEFAANNAWSSPTHYAGANSTAESLFSLMSGQSPLYWFASVEHDLQPLFPAILKRLGYHLSLFSSSSLNYRDMDRYAFGDAVDEQVIINDMKIGPLDLQVKRRQLDIEDEALVDRYLETSAARTEGRFFDFLFLFAPHYNYYYPDRFAKFQPALDVNFYAGDFSLREKATELHARYLNSVHYLDHLIHRIVTDLNARGQLDNTLIVVTGDHGEEFFEHGRLGHSMSLNDYQTRVPFVIRAPKPLDVQYSVTSHADVAPTVLSALDVSLPLEEMFSGKNLLTFDPARDAALVLSLLRRGTPIDYAVVMDGFKSLFFNGENDANIYETLGSGDEPVTLPLPPGVLAKAREFITRQKQYFNPYVENTRAAGD